MRTAQGGSLLGSQISSGWITASCQELSAPPCSSVLATVFIHGFHGFHKLCGSRPVSKYQRGRGLSPAPPSQLPSALPVIANLLLASPPNRVLTLPHASLPAGPRWSWRGDSALPSGKPGGALMPEWADSHRQRDMIAKHGGPQETPGKDILRVETTVQADVTERGVSQGPISWKKKHAGALRSHQKGHMNVYYIEKRERKKKFLKPYFQDLKNTNLECQRDAMLCIFIIRI